MERLVPLILALGAAWPGVKWLMDYAEKRRDRIEKERDGNAEEDARLREEMRREREQMRVERDAALVNARNWRERFDERGRFYERMRNRVLGAVNEAVVRLETGSTPPHVVQLLQALARVLEDAELPDQ